MHRVCVQVNLIRLGERLARTLGRAVTHYEVENWLAEQGFTHSSGRQWFCDGGKTQCLRPDEIIREMHLETVDGVTIIDPPPPIDPSLAD